MLRTHRSRRGTTLCAAGLIALSGLTVAACNNREVPTARPSSVPTIAVSIAPPLVITLTPLQTFVFTNEFTAYTLSGTIYDASAGLAADLPQARLSWHFAAPDLQQFNGQTTADANGIYRFPIRVRLKDDVLLTASASGYLPTTVRLSVGEIVQYGARLDFGLVKANGRWPTVPGDLGTLSVTGIVYDAYRGQLSPIGSAVVTITLISIVHPQSVIVLITPADGSFNTTLLMHSTDQINVAASANSYTEATRIYAATTLTQSLPLLIALSH
jgi:hypothetical protein